MIESQRGLSLRGALMNLGDEAILKVRLPRLNLSGLVMTVEAGRYKPRVSHQDSWRGREQCLARAEINTKSEALNPNIMTKAVWNFKIGVSPNFSRILD